MITLEDFKIRMGIDGSNDDNKIIMLLQEAEDFILVFTGRRKNQWLECFDRIVSLIAAVNYNRLGAEGFRSRKEGGISTVFHTGDDYPKSVIETLKKYRVAKGLNHE